ncbi:hypothetical protein KUTeg_003538 [Tegillarca granosa]|uniref:Uncharacterized protein n=1 Tax=Tegillarca granosa TaxID=220873 RepID=A0ABQ9FR91_TEGGR|nr:hypothetical protein KUTeg_003538 [Tegillarca granosa]
MSSSEEKIEEEEKYEKDSEKMDEEPEDVVIEETFIDRTERFLIMPDTDILSEIKDSTGEIFQKEESAEQEKEKYEYHHEEIIERRDLDTGSIGTPQGTEERPLSPSSYTLEVDESRDFGSTEILSREEPEGRMSADISQQIFIEQEIQMQRESEVFQSESVVESETVVRDETSTVVQDETTMAVGRPPSPSEFTLITSQDQEALAKALGIQTVTKDELGERKEEFLVGEEQQEVDDERHDGTTVEHVSMETLHDEDLQTNI